MLDTWEAGSWAVGGGRGRSISRERSGKPTCAVPLPLLSLSPIRGRRRCLQTGSCPWLCVCVGGRCGTLADSRGKRETSGRRNMSPLTLELPQAGRVHRRNTRKTRGFLSRDGAQPRARRPGCRWPGGQVEEGAAWWARGARCFVFEQRQQGAEQGACAALAGCLRRSRPCLSVWRDCVHACRCRGAQLGGHAGRGSQGGNHRLRRHLGPSAQSRLMSHPHPQLTPPTGRPGHFPVAAGGARVPWQAGVRRRARRVAAGRQETGAAGQAPVRSRRPGAPRLGAGAK